MDRYKQAQHDGLTEKALLNSERNDDTIRAAIDECDLIATSWGCHAPRGPRIDVVVALTGDKRITCSCCTNYGMPWHPLYVNRNAEPIPWTPLQWSTAEPQSLTWYIPVFNVGSLAE